MNYIIVLFALFIAGFCILSIAFNCCADAQTILPLELTRHILTDSNDNPISHTDYQGGHSNLTYSIPALSIPYFDTYSKTTSKVLDFKSHPLNSRETLSAASEPHTNIKKYFIAIMRTNNNIQSDLLKLYIRYLDNEDKVLSHPNEQNLEHTMQLPGEHGVQYFSLAEIRSNVTSLKEQGVEIVSYDLEKEGSPVKDLRNPVASVKAASDVVHKNRMKLMIAPSLELTSLYGAQFAKFVDIYNIQAQSLQSKPNEYKNYIEHTVKELRSANPEISISAQVSTARGSLDSMKNSISLVAAVVDGVTSWYSGNQKALDKLESFVKWFSDRYK